MELVRITAVYWMIENIVGYISNCTYKLMLRSGLLLEKNGYLKSADLILRYSGKVDYLVRFCIFSGFGLSADIVLFGCLVYLLDMQLFAANLISIYCAVTIAYVVLGSKIFNEFLFCKNKYIIFIAYHLSASILFSYILKILDENLIHEPLLSKLLIVLLSFICNYLFFTSLMKRNL